jgi:uncharacterized protein DUF2716
MLLAERPQRSSKLRKSTEDDFHVFLTEDFAAGTFGDPLRHSLCVFGADLLRTQGLALSSWLPTRSMPR